MSFLTTVDDATSRLFSENLRSWKAYRAKPVAVAATAVGEDAAVRGRVESAGYVTPALVTGRECVAGVITLWRYGDFGPQRLIFTPVLRTRAVQAFFVLDEAGDRILVSDLELILRTSEDDVTVLAQRQAYSGTPFFGFAQTHYGSYARGTVIKVTEQLLLPGAEVQVFGKIGRTSWIDQGAYRESMTEITSVTGEPLRRVVVRPPPSAIHANIPSGRLVNRP